MIATEPGNSLNFLGIGYYRSDCYRPEKQLSFSLMRFWGMGSGLRLQHSEIWIDTVCKNRANFLRRLLPVAMWRLWNLNLGNNMRRYSLSCRVIAFWGYGGQKAPTLKIFDFRNVR